MDRALAISTQDLGKLYRLYRSPMQRMLSALSGNRLKAEREFWALRDISFDLPKGRTLGIIGANGSGKSTLLQLIAGTLTPTTGRIARSGRIAALLELGAGFDGEFTGRENVFVTATLFGLSHEQIIERFASIEAFAEIGHFIDQPVKVYSSGMFVRLAFAVIAHVDADVLIIDEALAVGDAYFTQKCMRFLKRFMERGSVLFVSHDIAAVRALADDVLWIDQGRLRERGSAKAVGDAYLKALYAKAQPVEHPARCGVARSDGGSSESADAEPPVDDGLPEDVRRENMEMLALQNAIRVFRFDQDSEGFGDGGATIVDVELLNTAGEPLSSIVGGEDVTLSVTVDTHRDLNSPIVGFFLRNRLGQNVFGDNTYIALRDRPLTSRAGEVLKAGFAFRMPFLPVGDYSFCVAVASGSNVEHIQHHWRNEALVIRSLSANVHADVLGLPMREISLKSGAGRTK